MLNDVLQHSGAELLAHETIVAEQEQWGSIAQLAAEYESIAASTQHDRWAPLVRGSGLTDKQAESAIESEAFGPLMTVRLHGIAWTHQRPGKKSADLKNEEWWVQELRDAGYDTPARLRSIVRRPVLLDGLAV